MTKSSLPVLLVLLATALFPSCMSPKGDTPAEQRASVERMHDETLAEFYREKSSGKAEIEAAPGYAVFSNLGTHVLVLATGHGYGVVVDNENAKWTYMKMAQGGVGLGLGVKDFRAIFVFHDREVMDRFVRSGWDFGAEAEAAAKSGEKGGAASAADSIQGMTVYQLTQAGLALEATLKGTKYWKNDDLN